MDRGIGLPPRHRSTEDPPLRIRRKALPSGCGEVSRRRRTGDRNATAVSSPGPQCSPTPAFRNSIARKSALNAENLIVLGAAKLAELILNGAKTNAQLRKRANAGLARAGRRRPRGPRRPAAHSAGEGTRMVDWRKERDFAGDVKATADTILGEWAALDPVSAFARLVRFLASHGDVFGRINDSSGRCKTSIGDAAERTAELLGKMTTDAFAGIPAVLSASMEKGHARLRRAPQSWPFPFCPRSACGGTQKMRRCSRSGRPSPRSAATSTPVSRWRSADLHTTAIPSAWPKGCSTRNDSTRRSPTCVTTPASP